MVEIDKINNIARYNLIDTKYRQMVFRSARWRCSCLLFRKPWSNKSEWWPPERDNPWNLLFSSWAELRHKRFWAPKLSRHANTGCPCTIKCMIPGPWNAHILLPSTVDIFYHPPGTSQPTSVSSTSFLSFTHHAFSLFSVLKCADHERNSQWATIAGELVKFAWATLKVS